MSNISSKKISAIIIQGGPYDQEIYKQSLKSILWVDEIVKIDTENLKGNFADWRNVGAKKAKGDWLLYVDTDEIITLELRREIETEIGKENYAGYAIPRRNFIFGKEMRHCGLWPDYILHLIKKDKLIAWGGSLHEQPKINGKISHLKNPLIHKKHATLTEMVDKTNNWSEVEAKLMLEAHHPQMNIFRFASAGLREFWLRMIIQAAFLDGTEGVIYGLYQVYSRLISYSKLWEMQINHARRNI